MTLTPLIRSTFNLPLGRAVKVLPSGFQINGQVVGRLTGWIVEVGMVRKWFEDGRLACSSVDGVHAKSGSACATCRERTECSPKLRLTLQDRRIRYGLELAPTSASNFIEFVDTELDPQEPWETVAVEATVINRGTWGEVVFARIK